MACPFSQRLDASCAISVGVRFITSGVDTQYRKQ